MFTGLVEELGEVKAASMDGGNLVLDILAPQLAPQIKLGDSVNINGACQTAVAIGEDWFRVNTIKESLGKTNLGSLKTGDPVNLELALRPDSRLGGHMVSGHIDCLGTVKAIKQISGSWEVEISYPEEFASLIVLKGSIAISGVSLTVTQVTDKTFGVSLIPHTWEMTAFPSLRQGDTVNLEFDIIGKYVQKIMQPYKAHKGAVTIETFKSAGF